MPSKENKTVKQWWEADRNRGVHGPKDCDAYPQDPPPSDVRKYTDVDSDEFWADVRFALDTGVASFWSHYFYSIHHIMGSIDDEYWAPRREAADYMWDRALKFERQKGFGDRNWARVVKSRWRRFLARLIGLNVVVFGDEDKLMGGK